jgi:hypothetical protein
LVQRIIDILSSTIFAIDSGMVEANISHFLSRFRLHFLRRAITLLGVDLQHYLAHSKRAADIPRHTLCESDEISVENDARS